MENTDLSHLTLGRVFGFLTKQYIGFLTKRMENTPIERYYFPLFLIARSSGKISQQQLANQLLCDKVSMVRIIDCLCKDGMIERTVNPQDRRQHLLSVTAKGLPWVEEIEKALNETDEIFLSFIPEERRTVFYSDLVNLCHSVIELPVEGVELFYNRIKEMNHDETN